MAGRQPQGDAYRYTAGYDPYVKKAAVRISTKRWATERRRRSGCGLTIRPQGARRDYPFWLATGRVLEHWHSGSMTRRIKQLHQAVPAAYVELNRADAEGWVSRRATA